MLRKKALKQVNKKNPGQCKTYKMVLFLPRRFTYRHLHRLDESYASVTYDNK